MSDDKTRVVEAMVASSTPKEGPEAAKRLALMQRIELATTWELECFAAYLSGTKGIISCSRLKFDLYYGSVDLVHGVALAEND